MRTDVCRLLCRNYLDSYHILTGLWGLSLALFITNVPSAVEASSNCTIIAKPSNNLQPASGAGGGSTIAVNVGN